MMKKKLDLSKIEYKLKACGTWEKPNRRHYRGIGSPLQFSDYDFFSVVIRNKKGNKIAIAWASSETITYNISKGIRELRLSIELESILQEGILDTKEGIYKLLADIFIGNNIPYSVTYPPVYEITEFGDDERKYTQQPSVSGIMIEYFNRVSGGDFDLQIKFEFNLPIAFEDIEEAQNIEIREQALRKFGYENYVKEGFWNNKIVCVILSNNDTLYIDPSFNVDYHDEFRSTVLSRRDEEKIICFDNDIAFLQVKDSSTNKTYFLKVPPTMQSVEEAKAWTFGLNPGEYNPVIET